MQYERVVMQAEESERLLENVSLQAKAVEDKNNGDGNARRCIK